LFGVYREKTSGGSVVEVALGKYATVLSGSFFISKMD